MDARTTRHASRVLRIAIAIAAVVVGFGIAQLRRGVIAVVVDADVEGGSTMELFHNNLWWQSQRLALQPGRHLYRFEDLPGNLWSLRLDPTDAAPAKILLYRVVIEKDGRAAKQIGPAELRTWTRANVELVPRSLDVAEFRPVNSDPILVTSDVYNLAKSDEWLPGLLRPASGGSELFGTALIFVFVLVGVLPWAGLRQTAWTALVPAAALLAVIAQRTLTRLLGRHLGGVPSVAEAVGNASYLGYPKTADFRIYVLSVLGAATLGVVAGVLLARFTPPEPEPELADALSRPRWLAIFASAAVLVMYALSSFPALSDRLSQLEHQVHQLGYDDGNNFTWQYLLHRGWMPFREFWYPYGAFSRFNAAGWFPIGWVLGWLHEVLLLAIAGWSLHRLSRPSSWSGTLIFALLGFGLALGVFEAPGRYFLALDLALLALAARQEDYPLPMLLALAGFAVYAFWLEPNQVFYSGVPVVVLAGVDLWRSDPPTRAILLRRLAIATGLFIGGVALVLLVLWRNRQLGGFLEFLGQMGVIASYGSLPADFSAWYRLTGTQINLVLWSPLFLVALSGVIFAWRREVSPVVASSLVFGLMGAVVFTKFLVRPHIGGQVCVYSVLGLLLAVQAFLPHLRFAQRLVLLGGLGLLTATVLDSSAQAFLGSRARSLEALPKSLKVLERNQYDVAEMSFYEDAERYPDYREVIARLTALRRSSASVNDTSAQFFDLGDDSALYAALRQKPPYYISFYNASPLEAQEATVRWLEHERPEWLVWRPAFETFDAVPNPVRVPLLFEAAVTGYAPYERLGDFEILRWRDPNVPVDVDFWGKRLGTTLDLRAVPAVSGLHGAKVCRSEPCIDVLKVTVDAPVAGRKRTVPVTVESHRFEVTFTELAGQNTYFLYLDRIWFVGALERAGLRPQVALDAGPGARAERLRLSAQHPVLW